MGDRPQNIKYDWYQSESTVYIHVLVKNVKAENARIDLQDQQLTCTFKIDEEELSLSLKLAHTVQGFTWKLRPLKVEILLKKKDFVQWRALEEDALKQSAKVDVTQYPCSKPQKTDWDKLAVELKKQEEEEKLEGEAALNQLFQKIYADASDETRKAMNKSFIESGGTVLSTNWKEVSTSKVEVKPPEGMEFKKWDS